MNAAQEQGGFEDQLRGVLGELEQIEAELEEAETRHAEAIARAAPELRESARNLVHYLALRKRDIRALQLRLAELGLSSLGRCEARVSPSIRSVTRLLRRALDREVGEPLAPQALGLDLAAHTARLLGPGLAPLVMVTMPSEAAHKPELVRDLVAAGMQIMRVNCAHDDPDVWRAMVGHLRTAERLTQKRCKVLFDLPGPKLRTLELMPGPRVLRVRPRRDDFGRVLSPGRLTLCAMPHAALGLEPPDDTIWVRSAWLSTLRVGDLVGCTDTRGRRRRLRVVQRTEREVWCETERTVYIGEETVLRREVAGGLERGARPERVRAKASPIRLHKGDALRLFAGEGLGHPALIASDGALRDIAAIGCSMPEVVKKLEVGHPVFFDDGKIAAFVESKAEGEVLLRIHQARSDGSKLGADMGINVPSLELSVPALGDEDRAALRLAVEHADLVGLSFTRTADDVRTLHQALGELAGDRLGVILKIETQRGFEELPSILLEALRRPPVGVMIARGDLAVECGFERLAELQEEILWLCEAAHVPTIWATQVLENLAKQGHATRAEITDAAMSERAECVMLNKGPYVREAVAALTDILSRMRGHQSKKRSLLRPLTSLRLEPRGVERET